MSQLKTLFKRPFHRIPSNESRMPSPPNRPITLAVIGCGERGNTYASYCLSNPTDAQIVAIAEPRPNTRANFAKRYSVDHSLVFEDWKDLLAASNETLTTVGTRLADAVVVAVQDHMHCEVVLAFADQGYHILCEKPLATSVEDCVRIKDEVEKKGIIFGLGHVLRYSPYTQQLVEVIRSGELGELINITHMEPVGYWHFAHSYVRGNWSNESKSSFSLMTKCCHDIDLLCHWLYPATPTKVSSFGSLKHFRKESKPKEAGNSTKCLECPLQDTCPYSARRGKLAICYNIDRPYGYHLPHNGEPDIENITDALKTGPYGKCVYESENDVCDHQVVNFEFSNGSTCSFTLMAFTTLFGERQTRMHFTNGDIVGNMVSFKATNWTKSDGTIGGLRNGSGSKTYMPKATTLDPHGGGDHALAKAFVRAVREGKQEILGTDIQDVLNSHIAVFAAEESRKTGKVIHVHDFEREARERMKQAEPAVQIETEA
ncbi:hypothetical protein DL96DRAFT_1594016 [Flagelloscypha sp. PMI_526]|nr:hypothetical protein DL96DRAFT_1594016 [Flagelloscypha sp. PMI_526]